MATHELTYKQLGIDGGGRIVLGPTAVGSYKDVVAIKPSIREILERTRDTHDLIGSRFLNTVVTVITFLGLICWGNDSRILSDCAACIEG